MRPPQSAKSLSLSLSPLYRGPQLEIGNDGWEKKKEKKAGPDGNVNVTGTTERRRTRGQSSCWDLPSIRFARRVDKAHVNPNKKLSPGPKGVPHRKKKEPSYLALGLRLITRSGRG